MKRHSNHRRILRSAMLSLAGLALGAGTARADGDWTKRFRIGLVTGWNVKARFSLGGEFGVSGTGPGQPGAAGQNHVYDDGYVRLDDTGNAGGFTSNWGYQNASQFNPANQTLTFHGTTSFSQADSAATTSDAPYYGLDLAYGGRITDLLGGALGWEFGFSFMPAKFVDSSPHAVSANRVTDQFSTVGIVPPQAPYNGGAGGIGPTIQDVAQRIGSESIPGILTGTRALDVDLMNFRLGPNMQWHLGGRWAASLGGGLALGLATGDYSFSETLQYGAGGSASNSGSFGHTEWTMGGFAEALIYYRTDQSAELYLGAQYLSLGDATFSGGGRQATLLLGNGIMLAAGIHWIF